LYLFRAIVELELESYVQLSWILLCLANVHISFKDILSKYFNRAIKVEYCLLPMSLLFVWRSWQGYLLLSMTELAVEPTHEAVKNSFYLGENFERTIKVQLAYLYCLQIDIVKFRVIRQNILMVDWIHNWLRKNPFFHTFHTDSIYTIPKILNN